MKAKSKKLLLHVSMNGTPIGELIKHRDNSLSFQYKGSWLSQPQARPISLSLPLSTRVYQGEPIYNFFDNLLPDNPVIRARIQTKFQIHSSHPFDLLASIGRDCVGAIQLSTEAPVFVKKIQAEALTNHQISQLLKNYQTAPLGMANQEKDFRISIAGAQEKSAFLYDQKKWHLPLNNTPTTHIFKLPIGIIGHQHLDLTESCENEWLCTQIAKAFGFSVANSSICHFEDVKALVVERFDRLWVDSEKWLVRLPQEDCCQALSYSPNLKYESDGGPGIIEIMNLLLGSSRSMEDRKTFFKSQILFFLLAAIDGHAKNFSLFIEPGGSYRLTPLYDIMSAYPLIAKHKLQAEKIKMAMALFGKRKHYRWHTFQKRYFLTTAKASRIAENEVDSWIDEILENIDNVIDKVANKLPKKFPAVIAESIFKGMRKAKDQLI